MTAPSTRPKVLIANRGEIARRVIRACRRLGLPTVAVYSAADAGAAHVAEADAAVAIGPASPRESYLVAERLIEAGRATGARLIHPGYGFLSENAQFAQAVIDAGLTWIGPTPATIALMGDKQRARDAAIAAGVPVLPGSRRFAVGDLDGLDAAATAVGYPLLVKAAAGGGGIGMRRVDDQSRLHEVVAATQSMAAKAFGDGTIYLERLTTRARHVEVQVFGDGEGAAIHLFERDCSLQRRYQKVIEECPAPDLPPELTERMAQAAVSLAASQRYSSAGTVEFIVDVDTQSFHFLEMNTRIQVEHAVTEMITGRDLVAMQIELALGASVLPAQADIARRGAAIECRLYAENPAKRFLPQPGRLTTFRLPPHSMASDATTLMERGVRIDSGYREGDEVTPFYDPLIAKVIAHGPTREAARGLAGQALRAIEIAGIRTNREFLLACLDDPAFVAADLSTGFIDTHLDRLVAAAAREGTG